MAKTRSHVRRGGQADARGRGLREGRLRPGRARYRRHHHGAGRAPAGDRLFRVRDAQLEHAASDLFVERIAAKLGDPTVDPHGDPIPTVDGRLVVAPSELLSRLEPGATGRLVRVWNGNPEVLRYLDSCGIELGDRIEVLGREPFGGSLVIRVGEPKEGRVHGFGYGLADVLSIEVDQA
jgi:Fe2+ transport system protein FeoA